MDVQMHSFFKKGTIFATELYAINNCSPSAHCKSNPLRLFIYIQGVPKNAYTL